jgi:phosphoribosylamine--glycine ligase
MLIAPTRTLIVGSGGREHALAWKLAAEPGGNAVVVAPGSAAIAAEPRVSIRPDVDPLDATAVVRVAREASVELVVVGPEAPLAAGVADALRAVGIAVFGPDAAAARIESSKAFCREVAEAAGVRMARGAAFDDERAALAFAWELAAAPRSIGVVVKADGLAGGKGVTVADDAAQATAAIERLFAEAHDPGSERPTLVVEERLTGREASLIGLCDGRDALALPAARDHKRLLDGDRGPNTGGMGAYSPVPDLPDAAAERLVDEIHRPILAELALRGTPFRGALYAGLMLTEDGPRLLECNARFGDPETQVILPRLGLALGPLLLAAARGDLSGARRVLGLSGSMVPTTPDSAVAIVLAAAGYPERPRSGDRIEGLDDARRLGALVFHAGTDLRDDGTWVSRGGRVVAVVGRGSDLASARALAEEAADRVALEGVLRRHDIAEEPAVAAEAAR